MRKRIVWPLVQCTTDAELESRGNKGSFVFKMVSNDGLKSILSNEQKNYFCIVVTVAAGVSEVTLEKQVSFQYSHMTCIYQGYTQYNSKWNKSQMSILAFAIPNFSWVRSANQFVCSSIDFNKAFIPAEDLAPYVLDFCTVTQIVTKIDWDH